MFQERALAIMKSGKNVFLTGSAGTGKTYVLNQYIEYLKSHKVPVAVTASTGIAATHMNGTTIHSYSGIGIKDQLSHSDLRNLATKKYLTSSITKAHILIIDEISMLHRKQLDMVNQVLKFIRKSSEAFGGMQVIFAGDFFQLPPVSKEQETNREKFAFMSKAWLEAAPTICYLTEQYRQTNNSLNVILNEMRALEVSEHSVELLQHAKFHVLEIEPTRLYTHNADVDDINKQRLSEIDGETEVFFAEKKGNAKLLESFVKSLIVQDKLELKVGAKVMFLKNNHEKGIMNGSLGEVIGFDSEDNWPIVKLTDKRKITAAPEIWSIENEKGNPIVKFEQVPLRLAWAITVHKSQGMTLEAAEIDLGKTFERGQGYVALSRLKDIEGLKLIGLNRMALEVDPLAAKADVRFQELSLEAEDALSEKELEQRQKEHILDSGGTFDQKELAKHRSKQKGKTQKKNTYALTAELMTEGKALQDIAEDRGLSISTVKGHVLRISETMPKVDISAYRPDMQTLRKVKKAHDKYLDDKDALNSDGSVKLGPIYKDLKGKVDFEDIKLALAFIER